MSLGSIPTALVPVMELVGSQRWVLMSRAFQLPILCYLLAIVGGQEVKEGISQCKKALRYCPKACVRVDCS